MSAPRQTNRSVRLCTVFLLAASLSGTSVSQAIATATAKEKPLVVEEIAGSELRRITLSKRAVERLGIQTKPVASASLAGSPVTLSVPYSAIVYDKKGATWVYTTTNSLVFVRQAVTVTTIVAGLALLAKGPKPGTKVATVGVSELLGSELGVGGGH